LTFSKLSSIPAPLALMQPGPGAPYPSTPGIPPSPPPRIPLLTPPTTEYVTLDLAKAYEDAGFPTPGQLENTPRHRTVVARKPLSG
jgi:hypothetical protein